MSISDYVIQTAGLDSQHESPLMFPGHRMDYFWRLFKQFDFNVGAEIGVDGALFSLRLCKQIEGLRLFCIDPWICYGHYEGVYTQATFDRSYRKAIERLAPYRCEIIREFSEQAVVRFADASLDFVHIDGNRAYENVVRDLTLWSAKVRSGGIICGTCYYNFKDHSWCQVKDAVDDWTRANGIDPWFVAVHHRYPAYFWEVR